MSQPVLHVFLLQFDSSDSGSGKVVRHRLEKVLRRHVRRTFQLDRGKFSATNREGKIG